MKVHRTPESAAGDGGTKYFVGGGVRVQVIASADEGIDIVLVRFSPGARTYLHTHATTQVLLCVEGRGILATKSEQHLVEAGDIAHVPAGEEHWHGAAADSHFVNLAVQPPGESTWTRVDPLG